MTENYLIIADGIVLVKLQGGYHFLRYLSESLNGKRVIFSDSYPDKDTALEAYNNNTIEWEE